MLVVLVSSRDFIFPLDVLCLEGDKLFMFNWNEVFDLIFSAN